MRVAIGRLPSFALSIPSPLFAGVDLGNDGELTCGEGAGVERAGRAGGAVAGELFEGVFSVNGCRTLSVASPPTRLLSAAAHS